MKGIVKIPSDKKVPLFAGEADRRWMELVARNEEQKVPNCCEGDQVRGFLLSLFAFLLSRYSPPRA
jgi:hypothetical protein